MVIIYFSGTGNTKHIATQLAISLGVQSYSIEDFNSVEAIKKEKEVIFGFPVYASNLPSIVWDYIETNCTIWQDKKIFIYNTQGMVGGSSLKIASSLFIKYGATILGTTFFNMPDNIGDVGFITFFLPARKNKKYLAKADNKLASLIKNIKEGKYPNPKISIIEGSKLLKPDSKIRPHKDLSKCSNCNLCHLVCPSNTKCTNCYRCFSVCPKQAITLMGKKVKTQYLHPEFKLDQYLTKKDN
jgi:ferredoxin